MYNVSKTDHLVLHNQLMCYSLKKNVSSHLQHLLLACLSLCRTEAFRCFLSFWTFIAAGLIQLMVRQPCWWASMCVDSDISRRHTLLANLHIYWSLQFLYSLSSSPWFPSWREVSMLKTVMTVLIVGYRDNYLMHLGVMLV